MGAGRNSNIMKEHRETLKEENEIIKNYTTSSYRDSKRQKFFGRKKEDRSSFVVNMILHDSR